MSSNDDKELSPEAKLAIHNYLWKLGSAALGVIVILAGLGVFALFSSVRTELVNELDKDLAGFQEDLTKELETRLDVVLGKAEDAFLDNIEQAAAARVEISDAREKTAEAQRLAAELINESQGLEGQLAQVKILAEGSSEDIARALLAVPEFENSIEAKITDVNFFDITPKGFAFLSNESCPSNFTSIEDGYIKLGGQDLSLVATGSNDRQLSHNHDAGNLFAAIGFGGTSPNLSITNFRVNERLPANRIMKLEGFMDNTNEETTASAVGGTTGDYNMEFNVEPRHIVLRLCIKQ
jgi:hypothetical protein